VTVTPAVVIPGAVIVMVRRGVLASIIALATPRVRPDAATH
jgi:hypothetical protein